MMQVSIQRTAQCSCGSVNVVAVGAFADPAFPAPVRSVWERSRHAWMAVPVEHHFDKGRLPK